MTGATDCPVCGAMIVDDPDPRIRCLTRHPAGECCHAGRELLCDDGSRQHAVRDTNRCLIFDAYPERETV